MSRIILDCESDTGSRLFLYLVLAIKTVRENVNGDLHSNDIQIDLSWRHDDLLQHSAIAMAATMAAANDEHQ
jgi:hypothetical protein